MSIISVYNCHNTWLLAVNDPVITKWADVNQVILQEQLKAKNLLHFSCVSTRWMSSRRSCGSLPCALCGRREYDAASSPPPPPAGGASRPLSLPSAQKPTSARASEQCPKGGHEKEKQPNKAKVTVAPSSRLNLTLHFGDSPCRWRGLLSVFLPACQCVERRWPAPAARRRTREEPAAESKASPPQPANTRIQLLQSQISLLNTDDGAKKHKKKQKQNPNQSASHLSLFV